MSCVGDGISRCLIASCGFYLAVVSCIFCRVGADRWHTLTLNDASSSRIHSTSVLGTTALMTDRRNPPPRPTTPEDPTLQSRPPPRKCQFQLRSFGPAAVADIRTTPIESLDRQASPSTGSRTYDIQDSRDLLETLTQWEDTSWREDGLVEPDPTWGFHVMLTDYSPAARSKVDRAMEKTYSVCSAEALGQKSIRQTCTPTKYTAACASTWSKTKRLLTALLTTGARMYPRPGPGPRALR